MLRPFTEDDAPAILERWCADPAVTRFLRWPPHESLAVTQAVLNGWLEDYADGASQWAVECPAEGGLIGSVCLSDSEDAPGTPEPGYCYGRAYWGKGYATEALAAVTEFAFAQGAPRLVCCHALENPASGRVMRRCGFTPVRESVYHKDDGTAIPCLCYELTKETYDRTHQSGTSAGRAKAAE